MTDVPVNVGVEDELSESALRAILKHAGQFSVGTVYRRGGFGFLRKNIHGWNHAAKGIPFVLLTDLDMNPCPSALIQEWLQQAKHPNLLLRVAVREVESWLLADAHGLARFLRVPVSLIPSEPDNLTDPKRELIHVARQSRSQTIRQRLVPDEQHGSDRPGIQRLLG